MADQKPGVTYCDAPVFHFIPTDKPKESKLDYECPIYKTTERTGTLSTTGLSTNLMRSVMLYQTMEHPDYWIKKGAALVANLND